MAVTRTRGIYTGAMVLAVLTFTPGPVRPASSDIATLTLRSRVFGNSRALRVLLPPGYDAPANAARRYPVVYFTDGVAAWDGWGVPDTVRDLWARHRIRAAIFVGIDNGGSATEATDPIRDRASEYLPFEDQTWDGAPPPAKGELFPRFFFDEVHRLIVRRYRASRRPQDLTLAGASYGAIAALYTAMRYPDRVGQLLLESPSLHVGEGRLLNAADVQARWPRAVYVGVGTDEGDSPAAKERMLADARRLDRIFKQASPPPRSQLVVAVGGIHWFSAWRARLSGALVFLLGF
jgi:enterochelin esterase-like enzyme